MKKKLFEKNKRKTGKKQVESECLETPENLIFQLFLTDIITKLNAYEQNRRKMREIMDTLTKKPNLKNKLLKKHYLKESNEKRKMREIMNTLTKKPNLKNKL